MDWNTIANIVVFLVLPWFLPLLGALCLYLYKRGIAALPVAQRAEAVRIVQMAVNAIEQAMGGSPGMVKRQQAIDVITNTLKAAKITVPSDLINIALEEAVHAMNTPPVEVPVQVAPAPMPISQIPTANMPAVVQSPPSYPSAQMPAVNPASLPTLAFDLGVQP